MKKTALIIMLFCWATGYLLAQGIVNKGAGIWVRNGTTLKINGGYINRETGAYVGSISNDGTLAVREHWSNETTSGVVFQAESQGTVVLTGGNQTVSGNTHFYDLTKRVTSNAVLTFQAGSVTTIKGTLSLEGVSGQSLLLRSSADGSQWNIVPPQNHILRYLDIKDSNNNNTSNIITLENSCINSSGNTNWLFTPTITDWPSSASVLIHGQPLAESTLTGGTAVNGPNAVDGNFAFVNSSERPPVGTAAHSVKFVPSNPLFTEVTGGSIDVTVKNQSAPTALDASEISTTYFTANWEATAVAVSYRLDVSESSGFSSFLAGYNNRAVNDTSQIVSGLDPYATYYYRVRAVNAIGASSSNSNTITVNTLNVSTLQVPSDHYPTLESALLAANNRDTIQLAAGTYKESGLIVERDVTIVGHSAGTTILDAEENGRLFKIPNSQTVKIIKMSIQNGKSVSGGGILNYGTLTIENCEIRSCIASQSGGAINNFGELYFSGTTLSACSATATGGAIQNSDTAFVIMQNCTIANQSEDDSDSNGIYNQGTLSMDSCLLRGYSTGLKTTTGVSSLTNSIIAENRTNIEGDWDDNGYNIVSGDPGLMPLGNYGGPTQTCALTNTSPALNNGATELATDQRGIARLQNETTDIGPFESRFYSVEFVSGGNGSLSGQSAQSIAEYNSTTEITAIPATNFHFLDWTKNGESFSTANPLTVASVTENLVLTANFSKDLFNVLFKTTGQGSLEGETSQTVRYQDICTPVEAIAASGWGFSKWLDQAGNEYLDNPMVFGPVVGSSELTAIFTQFKYTISVTFSDGGSCQPTGDNTVNMGESLTIQIVPDGGYYTKEVIVDDKYVGAISSYTFNNVSNNHTLHATFVKTQTTTWAIDASSADGGTISPDGSVIVEDDGSATFSISPDEGWQISDVKVDNISQGKLDTYTFVNIKENHTIFAEFINTPTQTFTINASAGNGGEITPSGENNVQQGHFKTFTIQADSGFHIKQVLIDNVPIGAVSSYTFYDVSANHTIHAEFSSTTIDKHTIIATTEGGGRISPPGSIPVLSGNSVTFTITPKSGWIISDVIVDRKSIPPASTYTFTNVTGDHSIHAIFTPITYTITSASAEGGQILPSGTTTVNRGDSKTFTFVPDGGFYLKNVLVDGISVGAVSSYTFPNVSSNHSISAIFAKIEIQYIQIVSGSTEGGAISPSGIISVPKGTNATFTIKANEGFMIDDVNIDNNSVGGLESYNFQNVSSNHIIYAEFKEIPLNHHVISSSAEAGGTIAPSGQVLVNDGEHVTFTITPEEYYSIANVVVDGSSVGVASSYTMENVTTSHKIKAEFAPFTYRITTIAGEHGTTDPSGDIVVDAGNSQLFVFTPDPGYHVENVIIDGTPHGPMVEYEFLEIYSDHLLEVRFAPGEETYYVIHSTASKGGTLSPLGRLTVKSGENADFEILPKYGLKIKDVLVDGISVGAESSYTFTNVMKNHSLTAIFEKDESGGEQIVLGVSTNNAQGGWLTPKPGKYAVANNSVVQLKAIASETFVFDGWSIIGNGKIENPRSPVINLEVTGPVEITANFTPIISEAQLTVRQQPLASGAVSPDGTVFIQAGVPQQLLAYPAQGYEFSQWLIMDGAGEIDDTASPQTTLTASSNIEVAAIFIQHDIKADITIGVNGPGVVSPEGQVKVPVGTVLEVSALAATGHKFIQWEPTEGVRLVSPYLPDTKIIVTGSGKLNASFIASDETALLALSENDSGILETENIRKGTERNIRVQTPIHKVFDYWNCQNDTVDDLTATKSAVQNPLAPLTTVEVNQDVIINARFAKNQLTDSTLTKLKLDVQADTMKTASGKMAMSLFPCTQGAFDPTKDKLKLCFNGTTYEFPENSIRQIGKKDVWLARFKGDTGNLRLYLAPEKGTFNFNGKKLLLDNKTLHGEVNCSLQVGARYDFYRLTPQKELYLKFMKSKGIQEKLPVSGKEFDEFSITSATIRGGSSTGKNSFLKIRKMTFDLPGRANFDLSTETVSVQIGDLCINLPPETFKPMPNNETYRYNDSKKQILILLDIAEGTMHLSISKLKVLPVGCDDGQLDVYLRIGKYSGGIRLFFNSVKKHLYRKGKGK